MTEYVYIEISLGRRSDSMIGKKSVLVSLMPQPSQVEIKKEHYRGMKQRRLKSWLIVRHLMQIYDKENIKPPYQWPLVKGRFPLQRTNNAESYITTKLERAKHVHDSWDALYILKRQ